MTHGSLRPLASQMWELKSWMSRLEVFFFFGGGRLITTGGECGLNESVCLCAYRK